MNNFTDHSKNPVALGKMLSKGGEGRIYEILSRPKTVAKIWIQPDRDKVAKLGVMLQNTPRLQGATRSRIRLGWPEEALFDTSGKPAGFLMPRASPQKYQDLVNYCIPRRRRAIEEDRGRMLTRGDLLSIARNVAETFDVIHMQSCLIGDVNHTNFLVSPDTSVFLIDVDSMQVKDHRTGKVHRCPVGKEDFTSPRLMGKRFSEVDRTSDDDNFGLAVLIFQILMDGNHPYDPVDRTGSTGTNQKRRGNTANGESPYTAILDTHAKAWLDAGKIPDPALRRQMREHIIAIIAPISTTDYTTIILPRMIAWLELEPELQELFRQAFPAEQLDSNTSRPSPGEWIKALEEAMKSPHAAVPQSKIQSELKVAAQTAAPSFNFSPETYKLVRYSPKVAEHYRHSRWDAEHILILMLTIEDGNCCRILAEMQVDVGRASDQLHSSLIRRGQFSVSGQILRTPRMTEILEVASLEASHQGQSEIGPEHLLAAIAHHAGGDAALCCGQANISRHAIFKAVERMQASQSLKPSNSNWLSQLPRLFQKQST